MFSERRCDAFHAFFRNSTDAMRFLRTFFNFVLFLVIEASCTMLRYICFSNYFALRWETLRIVLLMFFYPIAVRAA